MVDSITSRRRHWSIGIAILAAWLVGVALLWRLHAAPFDWDEIDYVNASRLGIPANMLESGSLEADQFVKFGRAKYSGAQAELPPNYREERDPLLLRHYHPPLVAALLSLFSRLGSERAVRSIQLIGALLLIGVMLFSYSMLSIEVSVTGIVSASLLSAWLAALSFSAIGFHGWEALWTTMVCGFVVRCLTRRSRCSEICLGIALALALLTLESGLFVIFATGATFALSALHRTRKEGLRDLASFGRAAVVAAIATLAFWPGALLRLSLLKIPALYAYRIHLGQEYASVPSRTGVLLLVLLPALVSAAAACLWVLRRSGERLANVAPFLTVGVIYCVALIPFALKAHYLSPGVAPLACVFAAVVDRFESLALRVATMIAIAASVLVSWQQLEPDHSARLVREDWAQVGRIIGDDEALLDGAHVYSYYLGDGFAIKPIVVSYDENSILVRDGGRTHNLTKEEVVGRFVGIRNERTRFASSSLPTTILSGCSLTKTLTLRLYDCRSAGGLSPAAGTRVP